MTDIDLWSPAEKADPYPGYARIRQEAPVHRAAGPMGTDTWVITRYEDVRAALADPRLSKDPKYAPQWVTDMGILAEDGGVIGRNLLSYDPPDHTRLRRLVAKAFTRRRMEGLRPHVQEITDRLLDDLAGRTEVDLLGALAFPLPITVICELLGVPVADRADFRAWTTAFVSAPFTPEGVAHGKESMIRLGAYVRDLIGVKRAAIDPGADADEMPDLISALIVAADDGDRLTEDELVSMARLLLIAGHETTVNLIGNGTLALLTHPDQLDLLKADPGLLPGAVEELLRYDGPVERATPRFTSEAVTYSGVTIPKNSHVTVVLAAADRDDGHVPEPDRLDITREGHGHVAFGHGIHFCLGAPLARIEAQVAIGSLLRRYPDVVLAVPPGDVRWRPGGPAEIIRGLESLPIRI